MAVVPSSVEPPIEGVQAVATLRHPAIAFVARRLVTGILTLLVVSIVIFLATNILPGNAAVVALGRNATPARVHQLERRLNIDHSLGHRYLSWLGGAVHGNLGQSVVAEVEHQPASIASAVSTPLRNSLILALLTTILLIPL